MDTTNNDIDLLFETLNNLFQEQKEKIDEINVQIQKLGNDSPEIIKEIEMVKKLIEHSYNQQVTIIKELIRVIGEREKMLISEIKSRPQDKTPLILDRIEKMDHRLSELERPVIIREKWVTVLKKNWKFCLTFLVVGALFFGSVSWNRSQFLDNRELKKSDWKYRYIKMEYNEKNNLPCRLDSVFTYDAELTKKIQDRVRFYENSVKPN